MPKTWIASFLVLALVATLSGEPAPPRVKTHGIPLTGTISTVDESRKSFAVKNSAGKETRLVWTDATTIAGGKLSAGAKVTLRYLDKDGKHIATSVLVGEPVAARTPPGPAPTAPSKS